MIKLMTTKLRLSRQRLSAFCSEETTPTSAHSFLLVKGFSLNNVQTSLCLCLGKCSFPEVVEGKGRIILYFAQRDISCSLVQGCTPTLSSPHHQFGPSKIDWLIDLIVELGSRSGEGQLRVRKVKVRLGPAQRTLNSKIWTWVVPYFGELTWAILYFWFSPSNHPPPPPHKLCLAPKGSEHVRWT